MLSKLLKYDLRANLKIFLFIWPAILVFGLLERVALMAELPSKISAIFVNLTTVLFVLAVIAACVFALVISVIRFYSGLLRDEGYLMFTLPVRPTPSPRATGFSALQARNITQSTTLTPTSGTRSICARAITPLVCMSAHFICRHFWRKCCGKWRKNNAAPEY